MSVGRVSGRGGLAAAICALAVIATACERRDDPAAPGATPSAADAASEALTPRSYFFDDPDRTLARVSPDGQTLAWLAPQGETIALWTAPLGDMEAARTVAATPEAGVSYYQWAANNTHVIYGLYTVTTDTNRVFSVDVTSGAVVDLTPEASADVARDDRPVSADVVGLSFDYPDELLISANDYDPAVKDVHRVNIVTGDSRRVLRNKKKLDNFIADARLDVRLVEATLETGARAAYVRHGADDWRELARWSPEDATLSRMIGFDASGRVVYGVDSIGRETTALVRYDVDSGERAILGADDRADVDAVTIHPATRTADAFAVDRLKEHWTPLTTDTASAFALLRRTFAGEVAITSRTLDDEVWTVFTRSQDDPGTYHLLDRPTQTLTPLFQVSPKLTASVRSTRKPVVIKTAGGFDLVAHLTLPAGVDANGDGRPDTPAPLIIMAPEGPWKRFRSGFSRLDAFFADRGYAVLAVNARGARGFGKTHLNAVDRDWSGAVQEDLAEAAAWAVAKSVAPADRIGVFGVRLGGLAALGATAGAQDTFACANAVSPVADVSAFVEELPPHHRAYASMLTHMIGDPRDPTARAAQANRSLAAFAGDIRRPVFIVHGEADPSGQAPVSEAATLAATDAGAPITYAAFPDEPVFPMDQLNRRALAAASEAFFAGCLGGRAAPVGEAIARSSMRIITNPQALNTADLPLEARPLASTQ